MSEPQMPLIAQMVQIPKIKIERCLINVISVISVISGSDGFFPFSALPRFPSLLMVVLPGTARLFSCQVELDILSVFPNSP
jgi:hypothetical protein